MIYLCMNTAIPILPRPDGPQRKMSMEIVKPREGETYRGIVNDIYVSKIRDNR